MFYRHIKPIADLHCIQHTQTMLLPWLTKGSNLARNLKYTSTKAVGTISGEKRHSKQLATPLVAGTKHTHNRYVQVCLPHDAESRFLPIHTLCQSDCLHCFSGSSYKLKQVTDCKPAQFPIKPCICLEEDRGICCDPEDKHGDISPSPLCNDKHFWEARSAVTQNVLLKWARVPHRNRPLILRRGDKAQCGHSGKTPVVSHGKFRKVASPHTRCFS